MTDALSHATLQMGSQTALAAAMTACSDKKRYGQSHISTWKKCGKVPAEACVDLELATGIPRSFFRPDIFSPDIAINKESLSPVGEKNLSGKTANKYNECDGRQPCATL